MDKHKLAEKLARKEAHDAGKSHLSGINEKCRRCAKTCKQYSQVTPVVCMFVSKKLDNLRQVHTNSQSHTENLA